MFGGRARWGSFRFDDQADTSGGMAGRMQYACGKRAPPHGVTFPNKVPNGRLGRGGNTQPLRLHIEVAVEIEIRFMD